MASQAFLNAAAEGEQILKRNYEQAIEKTDNQETKALLRKQRDHVEFSEEVLRNMENRSADGNHASE